MKKYIVGALLGFLLSMPFTAFGSQIQSLVGKKVQVEYPVVVDGKQLTVKAVAIDGTSYAPNRAIAEAIGGTASFENKTIIIKSSEGDPVLIELNSINKRIMEINYEARKYIDARGKLSDEWYKATPERQKELEAEIKKLDDGYDVFYQEKTPLVKRRDELEAAQATPTP